MPSRVWAAALAHSLATIVVAGSALAAGFSQTVAAVTDGGKWPWGGVANVPRLTAALTLLALGGLGVWRGSAVAARALRGIIERAHDIGPRFGLSETEQRLMRVEAEARQREAMQRDLLARREGESP